VHAPINIYDLQIVNRDAGPMLQPFTVISMRSSDMTGLLYRTTGALAALELNIHVAQIGCENGIAEDVFFVTDAQGAIVPDSELDNMSSRLRALLQST
jgi:UTP:GlnB (protein PII) uridylyltransferase